MEHWTVYDPARPFEVPKQGFVKGLPAELYHGTHGHASAHGLMKVLRSPAHYWATVKPDAKPKNDLAVDPEPEDEKESAVLRFGRIIHAAILEPERFLKSYLVMPEFRGTGSRSAKAGWLADLPKDAIVLSNNAEADQIKGMLDRLLAHRVASNLLKTGVSEVSGFWSDSETGTRCRIRPDYLRAGPMVIDYKTCADASFDAFSKACAKFKYDVQAAHYTSGIQAITGNKCDQFVFIAQEKEPPYELMVYPADEGFIELGRRKVSRALRIFTECQKTGVWPGYSESPVNLSLPAWAFYEEE